MKKILSILTACFCLALISCNNGDEKAAGETKGSSMADKNLAASQVVQNAFMTGDVSKIDSVVADNFVDHTEKGDMGRDSLKAAIKMIHAMNMNMKSEVLSETADSDYVYTRMRFTGVSDGMMGMPAGPYDMHEMHVVRCKDGKAVEHWGFLDWRNVVKMMPPPPPAKVDVKVKAK